MSEFTDLPLCEKFIICDQVLLFVTEYVSLSFTVCDKVLLSFTVSE